MFFPKKKVIGLIEPITLEDCKKIRAKVDTGADSSSIDKSLLKVLGVKKLGPTKIVRSALGEHKRPTVMLDVEFKGKKFRKKFSVSNRSKLKYKVLIGKDILKKEGFIIDPNK